MPHLTLPSPQQRLNLDRRRQKRAILQRRHTGNGTHRRSLHVGQPINPLSFVKRDHDVRNHLDVIERRVEQFPPRNSLRQRNAQRPSGQLTDRLPTWLRGTGQHRQWCWL